MDSRRRTVAELTSKISVMKAKIPQTRAKGEMQLEAAMKRLHGKETKLNGAL